MAAIDFPASPADGALFRPSLTGITYQFSASPSPGLWKPVQSGTSPGGEFNASIPGSGGIPASAATLFNFTTIIGNSGNWFNNSNGQYIPPPGRYFLYAQFLATQTAASHCFINLRKNGIVIQQAADTIASASFFAGPSASCMVTANGTDVFDMQISANAGATGSFFEFGAFPLSGIQGPPGPVNTGQLTLFSEQILVVPANVLAVNFPVTARIVELYFELFTSPNADVGFSLQGMRAGVPDTSAAYSLGRGQSNATSGASAFGGDQSINGTSWGIAGGFSNWGKITFSAPSKGRAVGQTLNINLSGLRQNMFLSFESALTGLDGYRVLTSSGNWAIGSSLRCLIVP